MARSCTPSSTTTSICGLTRRVWPCILRITGRPNSSKVTALETGLPGRPSNGTPLMPEGHRLAGAHIDAPEVDLALLLHDIFDEIEVAHGDTAGGQDEIVGNGRAKLFTQALDGIPRNAQAMRLRPGAPHGCLQQIAVAIANLARLQGLIHVDNFISGAQDRHAGAAHNGHHSPAERRQHADRPRPDLGATAQDALPGAYILAGRANIAPRSDLLQYLYPFALGTVEARQFDLDDAIGPRRHRSTGHDAHGRAFLDRAICDITGCDSSGD